MRLTVPVKHLRKENRSGIYRYRRRVPEDLRLVIGKSFIDQTLETTDELVAIQRREEIHQKVQRLFAELRSKGTEKLEYQTAKETLKDLGVWQGAQSDMQPVLLDTSTPPVFEKMTQAEPPRVYRRVKHSKGEPYDEEIPYPCLSGQAA